MKVIFRIMLQQNNIFYDYYELIYRTDNNVCATNNEPKYLYCFVYVSTNLIVAQAFLPVYYYSIL